MLSNKPGAFVVFCAVFALLDDLDALAGFCAVFALSDTRDVFAGFCPDADASAVSKTSSNGDLNVSISTMRINRST